jgi:hypothetical protein
MTEEHNKPEEEIIDSNQEWRRVISNPDNVIISDSLIARVDPYNLGAIANPIEFRPFCKFTFTDHTLTGEVISFSNVDGKRSYTFSTSLKEASQLMGDANIQQFAMLAGKEELLSMDKDHINNFNFNVDVQNSTTALVTITFGEVSE